METISHDVHILLINHAICSEIQTILFKCNNVNNIKKVSSTMSFPKSLSYLSSLKAFVGGHHNFIDQYKVYI